MENLLRIENIKVYIKTDEKGNVIAVNSEIFLENTDGWILIDEGVGVKYAHAQGNYFSKPLMGWNGVYNYKYENGEVREKITEEIEMEEAEFPAAPPTETELLNAQLAAVKARNEFLEDCIAEMAVDVYKLR